MEATKRWTNAKIGWSGKNGNIVTQNLESHLTQGCVDSLIVFGLDGKVSQQASYVRYLKFQVISFYGEGGGLQHLSFHGTLKGESKKVGSTLEKIK